MQVTVYVPATVEIPSEYLPALAKRAADHFGESAAQTLATRGHLVRQAVLDGLLRGLEHLRTDDGGVDLVCDPAAEIPLEIEGRTISLAELLDAIQVKRSADEAESLPQAA
jgi:hypothetical protein